MLRNNPKYPSLAIDKIKSNIGKGERHIVYAAIPIAFKSNLEGQEFNIYVDLMG